jgi:outer membrane receptor protein involved in Fe transport
VQNRTQKSKFRIFFVALLPSYFSAAVRAETRLEEVVVTAQMREQSVQQVPIALSVFGSEALGRRGLLDIKDIAHVAPELEVQSNTEPVRISYRIRRVGNLSNIPTFEPEVAVFIDGAFRSRTFYGAEDLVDIERVEILRGPQLTLYGKNAAAGVVGFYSKKPNAQLTSNIELTAGAIEGATTVPLYRFKGSMEGSLSDALRGSLGMAYRGHDHTGETALAGYSADLNNQNKLTLRSQLDWQHDVTEVRFLIGHGRENDDTQDGDLYYDPNGWVANFVLPTLRTAGIGASCSSNSYRDRRSCVRNAMSSDLDSWDATLLIDQPVFETWQLSSVTAWDWFEFKGRWDDAAQVGAPLMRFHDQQQADSLQQQLRLTSPAGENIEWMFGTMVYRNRFRYGDSDKPMFLYDTQSDHPAVIAMNNTLLGAPIPMATPGQLGYFHSTQDSDYLSTFSQTTWNIDSATAITAGLRWQRERKSMRLNNTLNDYSPSVMSVALVPVAVNGSDHLSSEGVSWSLTPQYRWRDTTNFYVTVAQGIKAGGFNTGYGNVPINRRRFKDESITHYESGVKASAMGGKARWAFNVFHTEFEDFQDAAFIGAQYRIENAERADLEGFELEGEVIPMSHVTLDAQISYANFVYGKNTHGQCHPFQTPNSPTDPAACDLSGKHPINTPPWKAHFGAQFDQPQPTFNFYERVDWLWTDSYNTSFSADPRLTQRAYSWINVRGGINWPRYDIALWINNVLNETVVDSTAVQNFYAGAGDGSVQAALAEGRSYGVTVSLDLQ